MKVSWQVTGIRKDAYANANRIQVERGQARRRARQLPQPGGLRKPASMGLGPDQTSGNVRTTPSRCSAATRAAGPGPRHREAPLRLAP